MANICCMLCCFSYPFPRETTACGVRNADRDFFLLKYGHAVDLRKERLKKRFALEIEGGEALRRSMVTESVSASVKQE